jgi:hypothetical protein
MILQGRPQKEPKEDAKTGWEKPICAFTAAVVAYAWAA